MLKRVGHAWSLLAVALFFVPIGCTALPDVTPFATSSREFASGVKAAGRVVSEDLRSDDALAASSKTFDEAWDARNKAMEGVVQYADGLAAIVKSTQDARAQAKSLGNKLETLARAAGVVNPAIGASVAVGIDVASFIYGQIAIVRGANSLQEAMDAAQPAIDKIAEIITKDSENLKETVLSTASLRRNAIMDAGGAKASSYLRETEKRRDEARAAFARDPSTAHREELLAADRFIETARSENERFRAEVARANQMSQTSAELVQAMRDGVSRWTAAHRQVAQALKDRQSVSVDSLTDAAVEVRDLLQRLRALRSAK